MHPPRVSVVIPTCNRRQRLERVLDSLSRQTLDRGAFEVVVVDDGSSDGTAQMLAGLRPAYALRSHAQANAGPASARNRGIEAALGEIVLFLDDDVMPEPELIAEHLRSHDEEACELVVIGPLASLAHYDQPWVAWEQSKIEGQYRAMAAGVFAPTFRQFWTGNASVPRRHLLQVGGFNIAFSRGEDVELGARLHALGLQFRFNPRAIGVHHAERSLQSWCQAHRSYGRLEVTIFGQLGEEEMLETIAGNFGRLPVGVQLALRHALLGRPPRWSAALERALTSWLVSAAARRTPVLTSKVCSLLANLLYWQASASALGTERLQRMLTWAPHTSAAEGGE